MISAKQLEANRENARHSTGPQTPEGKAAVRLNALKHGMRARMTVLPFEDPAAFEQLHEDLTHEWQPESATQRLYVEQMAVHQWLLIRLANFERSVFAGPMDAAAQMALLERFSTQRARLERSFSNTLRDLRQLQRDRPKPEPVKEIKTRPEYPAPPPEAVPNGPGHVYVMSNDTR